MLSQKSKNNEWQIEVIGTTSVEINSSEFNLQNSQGVKLFLIDNGFGVVVTDLHDLNKKTLIIWEIIGNKGKIYEIKNPPSDFRHIYDLYFDQLNRRFIATISKSAYAEHAHYWTIIEEKKTLFSKEFKWCDNSLYYFLEPDKHPLQKVREDVQHSFKSHDLQQLQKSPIRIVGSEIPEQIFVDQVCVDKNGLAFFSSPGSYWLKIKSYNRLYDWNVISVFNSKFQLQNTQEITIGKTLFSYSSALLMVIPYPKADSMEIYSLNDLSTPKILKPIKQFIPNEMPPKTLSIFDINNSTVIIGNWKGLQISKIN